MYISTVDKLDEQVLGEALRRQRAEAARLENVLAGAVKTRQLAGSAWIGNVEVSPESVPTDEQIAKHEERLAAARARLAEPQAADDELVRSQVEAAERARAAHAAAVDEAERAVYLARLDADLAIVARLDAARAGDLDAYIPVADTSDAAQRRLAAAKARLANLQEGA